MGISLPVIGVPGLLGGGVALDSILTAQNNLLYYKYNEASGNLLDYGSEGADGTVSGATQGQPGIAGLGAYLYDKIDDAVSVPNASIPTVKALTTRRWGFFVNTTSLGEIDQGALMFFGNGGTAGDYNIRLRTSNRLEANVDTDGVFANALSNALQLSDIIGVGAWLFVDYDDADALGNGRKIRLFKGVGGTVTQLTLGTDTAATGTVVSASTDLELGNDSDTSRTFDGLFFAAVCKGALWTADEMQQLTTAAGV